MRLRNIPGSEEALLNSTYVIDEPEALKGRWQEEFGNENPIYAEIGMGKGRFIIESAKRHPERNYIGIEMYSSVLVRAVQKLEKEEREIENLRLLRIDARDLASCFDQDEIAGIYLNFSDPWPKDRHAKRRLPGKEFLKLYDRILQPEGRIEFKTDNKSLFEFALEQLPLAGWKSEYVTFDLHADAEMMKDNVLTEYEEKFAAKGNPICKYIIFR